MSASTAERDTPQSAGPFTSTALTALSYPMAASTKIFAGNIVGLDASGNAGKASSVFTRVVGRAEKTVDNSAGIAAALSIDAAPGAFMFDNGDSIVAADFGKSCYLSDDHTVNLAPTNSRPVAGVIMGLSGTQVIVAMGPFFTPEVKPVGVGTMAAFAANSIVVDAAAIQNGVTYQVPTTAGVSTIVLPADSAVGTTVTFAADGTANGHTVQYVDATGTTNLTTALTASKRHLVTAIKISSTKWVASAYVSP